LNSKYLYLSIDLLSVIVPFISSFYSKAPFYKKWKFLGWSTLITATVFIIWDEIFTRIGVWGFNPAYLTGYYFFSLPIEEILFFFCIPYACVFTYEALNYAFKKEDIFSKNNILTFILIIVLLIGGLLNLHRWYTSVTFIVLAVLLAYLTIKVKPTYMGRFYFSFLITLIPFLIVNGILTGSFIEGEVVWYNDHENLDIRIGTIPLEDMFYGMLLILMNISIFEWLQVRDKAVIN